MAGYLQFIRPDGAAEGARFNDPLCAVEKACQLLDDGCDVLGPLSGSIDQEQIKLVREKRKTACPR
jgi:hypothetical protein